MESDLDDLELLGLNFSTYKVFEPQYPHLYNGDNIIYSIM